MGVIAIAAEVFGAGVGLAASTFVRALLGSAAGVVLCAEYVHHMAEAEGRSAAGHQCAGRVARRGGAQADRAYRRLVRGVVGHLDRERCGVHRGHQRLVGKLDRAVSSSRRSIIVILGSTTSPFTPRCHQLCSPQHISPPRRLISAYWRWNGEIALECVGQQPIGIVPGLVVEVCGADEAGRVDVRAHKSASTNAGVAATSASAPADRGGSARPGRRRDR
jgi:hypothetical protein